MKQRNNGIRQRQGVLLFSAFFALGAFALAIPLHRGLRGGGAWLAVCGGLGVAALLVMAGVYVAELRRNLGIRQGLERLICGENEQEYLSPEEKGEFLQMTDWEMLDRVIHELHEASAARALKTEAELHALQNQINPHFLYNTLEIIRSRAMRRGCEDVAEMVEALGMLFRYCINSPGELATLAQELDNVHDYLLIQRYRYGDRFTYREIIAEGDKAAMNSSLPVMTLQPLIENALVHGVNPKIEGGSITLRVECLRSRLQIIVEDDGVGIPEEELRRVRKSLRERGGAAARATGSSRSVGIAMQNVNRRIQFYFGMQYGVDVTSTQGVGTMVVVTLPRLDAEEPADGR